MPGEMTLARSDEEISPLNIEEMRALMQEPHSDVWEGDEGPPSHERDQGNEAGDLPRGQEAL